VVGRPHRFQHIAAEPAPVPHLDLRARQWSFDTNMDDMPESALSRYRTRAGTTAPVPERVPGRSRAGNRTPKSMTWAACRCTWPRIPRGGAVILTATEFQVSAPTRRHRRREARGRTGGASRRWTQRRTRCERHWPDADAALSGPWKSRSWQKRGLIQPSPRSRRSHCTRVLTTDPPRAQLGVVPADDSTSPSANVLRPSAGRET